MLSTKTVEVKLPGDIYLDQNEQLQRSVIHHLLIESKMTMASAITLLPMDDLQWLVTKILQAAQESLFIACHIGDEVWSTRYWQRYNNQLGHLFIWYHKKEHLGECVENVSNYHGQLLSILRTISRRYLPQNLNADQIKLVIF